MTRTATFSLAFGLFLGFLLATAINPFPFPTTRETSITQPHQTSLTNAKPTANLPLGSR